MKFGGGVAGAVIGFVLSIYGYNGMDKSTIAGAVPGIRLLMSVIPVIFIGIAILIMIFYPLTQNKMEQIQNDLTKIREKQMV